MSEHKLVSGSLVRQESGIVARCECGWASGGHFSSFAASAAFREHKEGSALADQQTGADSK